MTDELLPHCVLVDYLKQSANMREDWPNLEAIEGFLTRGIEVNPPNVYAQSALSVLGHQRIQPTLNARKAIMRLVEAGANPLAFDRALDTRLVNHSTAAVYAMLRALAASERQGVRMRREDGGNALHVLAASNMTDFQGFLHAPVDQWQENISAAWVSERRLGDGFTPGHLLWQRVVNGLAGNDHPSNYGEGVWRATDALVDRQCDFGVRDALGLSLAGLIGQCLELGWRKEGISARAWAVLEAQWELEQLDRGTAHCETEARLPVRL